MFFELGLIVTAYVSNNWGKIKQSSDTFSCILVAAVKQIAWIFPVEPEKSSERNSL